MANTACGDGWGMELDMRCCDTRLRQFSFWWEGISVFWWEGISVFGGKAFLNTHAYARPCACLYMSIPVSMVMHIHTPAHLPIHMSVHTPVHISKHVPCRFAYICL